MWKLILLLCVSIQAQKHEDPPPAMCVEPSGGLTCKAMTATTIKSCQEKTPKIGFHTDEGFARYLFYDQCNLNWKEAQEVCHEQGGRLWEPQTKAEYMAVFNSIGYSTSFKTPNWLWTGGFHWWIGLFNLEADGSGSGSKAQYSSSGAHVDWMAMAEAQNPGQDCVDIFGNRDLWGDHPCTFKLKFICQIEASCKFQGRIYKPGMITAIPHCCSYVHCDKDGSVSLSYLIDWKTGRNATDCCLYGNSLTMPNRHTYDKQRFCCEGKLIQTKANPLLTKG